MQNISRSKEQNTGGIQLLKFALVEWILDIPIAIDGKISEEIAFVPGTTWRIIDPVKESATYTETENNLIYEQSIQLVINRSSPEVQYAIELLKRRRLIFLVYDNNYQEGGVDPLLVGTLENWLSFSRTRKTGKLPSELNHYALNFKGKTYSEAVYYTFR